MATDAAATQYAKEREQWEHFTKLVEQHVRHLLDEHGVPYHTVTSRTKSFESFQRKCDDGKYDDPNVQILDKTAIRIITHLQSERAPVEKLIDAEFEIIPEHSPDKQKELGTDRMGYRSTNLVCKPREKHLTKKPWHPFRDWPFEIQVRSLLDHAWAELSRSKSYRFSAGPLPSELQRRFSLLAAVLELADRECDSIAGAADAYALEVRNSGDADAGDIEINAVSLPAYLERRLPKFWAARGPFPDHRWTDAVEELKRFGCRTLVDIDELIPDRFDDNPLVVRAVRSGRGLFRCLMMLKDFPKFVEVVWEQPTMSMDDAGVELASYYGLDMKSVRSDVCQIGIE